MAKILVVEEDAGVRQVTISALRRNPNYEITEADDGLSGLEQLSQQTFDLVVTDWKMRFMDGNRMLAVARRYVQILPRIIVITGGDVQECWNSFGPVVPKEIPMFVVLKPYDMEGFLGIVANVLKIHLPL